MARITLPLLLTLATSACTGDGTDPGDSTVTGPTGAEGDDGIDLVLWENPESTLSVLAEVLLEVPGTVHVELWSDDVAPLRTRSTARGTEHDLEVVGMRAEATYTLQAVATLEDGTELRSETWAFESGSLPDGIPTLSVTATDAAERAITLVGPTAQDQGGPGGGADEPAPYLIGLDEAGEVVWYYQGADITGGADHAGELLEDGTLLVVGGSDVRSVSPGGAETWTIPTNSVGHTHHDAALLPSGNVVVMGQTTETVPVPSLGGEQDLVGDVLVELDPDGNIVWTWSAFDHLDTTRFPGTLSKNRNKDGALDWTHSNALFYVEHLDALLVSVRHQNQVIAIDRDSSEVLWTLGADGDFALTSGGWFASQHAASMVSEDEVMLYDNGNEKADPESRAVRYRLDFATWTAEQVWSWDVGAYTENLGDADLLESGNTLVCAGGRRSDGSSARIAEVTADGDPTWDLVVGDDKWVYRATRVDWIRAAE